MPSTIAIPDDPRELRRCLRDVLALSVLPAIWVRYDARQIAESVAEVLVKVLHLDVAHLRLDGDGSVGAMDATCCPDDPDGHAEPPVDPGRMAALARLPLGEVQTAANPRGPGSLRTSVLPVAFGRESRLVAASARGDFPTARERLLLGVAASQTSTALRRCAAERALLELNEHLERRIREESESRIEAVQALRQAQKMDAIGQLVSGIAHDFNNLLVPILGNIEMLQGSLRNDPATADLVTEAGKAARLCSALTSRLVAFARAQELTPENVDIGQLLEGMLGMLQRTVGPGFVVELRPGGVDGGLLPGEAFVDPGQIELAVLNLVLNARDAMPEGGRIRIGVDHAEADGSRPAGLARGEYVRLWVADSGTGMDPTTIDRAVEPFFTTKEIGEGTGLGLSMVHGLAAQLGGTLELSSRLGVGTRATLWLPRSGDAEAHPRAEGRAPALSRPYELLLVDDNDLARRTLGRMLENLGQNVVQASSARRALEILEDRPRFDLVITDHAMPDTTGVGLAEAIHDRLPELPVLLVTGHVLSDDETRGLPRVEKPCSQADLARAIDDAIRRGPRSA